MIIYYLYIHDTLSLFLNLLFADAMAIFIFMGMIQHIDLFTKMG